MLYYIVEIACVITEMWMIHIFLSGFLERRDTDRYLLLLSYFTVGVFVTILSLIEKLVFARLIFAVISVFAISMVFFRVRPLSALISSVTFCAISAATDIVSALVFQLFGVQNEALMANHTYRSFYLVACHIIMFGLVLLVCIINHKTKREISLRILLPVTPCWVISILLCFLLTWQCFVKQYDLHPLFIFVLLGLLYTSILVIYYTNRIHDQAQEKKTWEIAEHHYAMQQEYYDQLRIQQEETRALWHDISKYLRASRVESSEGALVQVQEMLDSISCVVDVNNRIVSVILNEYVQATRAAEIELELDVQVPKELFVTAADLYVLIGNTMDNAIEACQSMPPKERRITLKLKVHNNILFFEMSNPYSNNHQHRFRNSYHGYGLKNVARCVDKYNGKIDISKKEGIFQVTAYMNST